MIRDSLIKPKFLIFLFSLVIFSLPTLLFSQTGSDSLSVNATLNECLKYAFHNQPVIKQAGLEENITKQNIRISLSEWLPQINASANILHYYKAPVSLVANPSNPSGPAQIAGVSLINSSGVQFSASQVLFNNDVFFAGRTAKYFRQKASESTQNSKIDLVVNVSKAYYDVMLTQQQLNLLNDEIERLRKNLKDAYSQYQNGLTDKIDYKRATISLNNANAEKKSIDELLKVKYAFLKQQMGYPMEREIFILYDSSSINNDIYIDTIRAIPYQNRIEFKILQTQLIIQKYNISYYKMAYIPSLSAFANYNMVYQNDQFSNLFSKDFPNSALGLTISLPLFQGTRRISSLEKARLQYSQLALDTVVLKNLFNTEYSQALAIYKSNLAELHAMQENVVIAHEVYNMVKFQYEKGIKSYLEVIISETDLRNAEINHLNALFHVLTGKLDVQKALGTIFINF